MIEVTDEIEEVMDVSAAVEVTIGDLDPGTLEDARFYLGSQELGRLEGRQTVRWDIPAGRHVLHMRAGYGMSAAIGFRVQHRNCAVIRLVEREPDSSSWGLVFGGFHELRRAGTEHIDPARPGAEETLVEAK